jgi:phage FluMu protein Com
MVDKKFQRKKEDFICEKCGAVVKGGGYTDHCPKCLTGKHVDNNPGDRASNCLGLMFPIRAYYKNSSFIIVYKCNRCSRIKEIKAAAEDNQELLFKLVNQK